MTRRTVRAARLLALCAALVCLGLSPSSTGWTTIGPEAPAPVPASTPTAQAPRTVVSLTFDDGRVSQRTAVEALDRVGLKGTFYVNSGFTGSADFLTREDLRAMAASGHEIGGHTVQHRPFSSLSTGEMQRQICLDRQNLTRWGFEVTSFAYPFGTTTRAAERVVEACGYRSARGLGDVRSASDCRACPAAEKLAPADAWDLRAPDQVESTWSLTRLQEQVLQAEAGGGWVILTFHDVCDDACSDIATPVAVFDDFVRWLAERTRSADTAVATVHDVVGGTPAPIVPPKLAPDAGRFGRNGVVDGGLDDVDRDGGLRCWEQGGWGTNRARFRTVPDGRGGHAEQLTVTDHESGDAKLLSVLDLGDCTPTVRPQHTYELGARYSATARTQFTVYLRDETGTWRYWTQSGWFPPTSGPRSARWATPPVPEGCTGLSFGLNLAGNGTLTTDDYVLTDRAPAPLSTDAAPRLVPQP